MKRGPFALMLCLAATSASAASGAKAPKTGVLSGNVSCHYIPEIKSLHCGFDGDVEGIDALAPSAKGDPVTVVFRDMKAAVATLGMSGAGVEMARKSKCIYDADAKLEVARPTLMDDEGGWLLEVDLVNVVDSTGFSVGSDQALRGHSACKP